MRRIAALLVACLLGGSRWASQASGASDAAQLMQVAAALATLEDGATPASVAQRLASLGATPAALVFDALGRSELPLADGTLVLGERERATLLEGARRVGRFAFVPLWNEAADAADAPRRRTVIELVGYLGAPGDLRTAALAATPVAGAEAVDPEALTFLEVAVAQMLGRTEEALFALRPAILDSRPEIAGVLIRAVGREPDGRTLAFLTELLGFDERLDLPLLSTVEGTARMLPPPFAEPVCAAVREYVVSTDRQLARAATMALGALQDEDSLPALIELSTSSDRALAGAAFVALERTTGLALPRRPERWRAWLQSEQRWVSTEGARILAELNGENAPSILSALRELAVHRFGRHRAAPQVAFLLEHPDARVRGEACRTLAALASPRVRAALQRATSDPEPSVAAAAETALRSL